MKYYFIAEGLKIDVENILIHCGKDNHIIKRNDAYLYDLIVSSYPSSKTLKVYSAKSTLKGEYEFRPIHIGYA